jgi:hypothetical protein
VRDTALHALIFVLVRTIALQLKEWVYSRRDRRIRQWAEAPGSRLTRYRRFGYEAVFADPAGGDGRRDPHDEPAGANRVDEPEE